jgi:hypothetical protein
MSCGNLAVFKEMIVGMILNVTVSLQRALSMSHWFVVVQILLGI